MEGEVEIANYNSFEIFLEGSRDRLIRRKLL
jgi:hypothetical protein